MNPAQAPVAGSVARLVVAGSGEAAKPASAPSASTGIAVIGTNFAGVVTLWAAKAQSMFGWTSGEAVGRHIDELMDLGLTVQDFAEFVFVGGHGAFSRDLLVTTRRGVRASLRMTATIASGPDGEDEIIASFQPADGGQPALREGNRALRLIADRGSDLVLICDRAMAISYAGPMPSYTCGHQVRDLVGASVEQFVHPGELPRLRREWQRALREPGSTVELELRARDVEGAWRWARLRLRNLLADRSISAMVVNITDVTEQRRVQQRLESSSRMLAELMDCALEGVWVIDPAGRTVIANARMAELLAVDHARLLEGSVFDFIDAEAGEFIRHRLNHRATGAREQYECSLVRRDGARRWFQVSASPRYSKSGKYLGSIGMCHDITDRKLLERELGRREPGAGGTRAVDDTPVPGLDRLSRREHEVVRMLLRGDRVPVIARQLYVSQSTVRNHLSSVFRKLQVTSQQELIVLLRERRLTG